MHVRRAWTDQARAIQTSNVNFHFVFVFEFTGPLWLLTFFIIGISGQFGFSLLLSFIFSLPATSR